MKSNEHKPAQSENRFSLQKTGKQREVDKKLRSRVVLDVRSLWMARREALPHGGEKK